MALGLHESRRQRSRRKKLTFVKWLLFLACLVGAGYFAYVSGSELARLEVHSLSEELAQRIEAIETLEDENAQLRADLGNASLRERRWQQRYATEVPSGPAKELFAIVSRQLGNGITAERLAFVIEAADNERNCENAPVTKRFIVRTPVYQGANDSVTFANNSITVTAEGDPATNAQGNVEAWFDPDKPIKVVFTHLGGERVEARGLLPVHHSIVENAVEHRFTVRSGERGFVRITGDQCRYP